MKIIEQKIVLRQFIMYADTSGENNNVWYMFPGKQSSIFDLYKVKESFYI